MNVFDLIILAVFAILTLRGIWKGMVSQIVSVASFFVCWIVASRFGCLVAPTIPLEAPWNQVAAMAVIFLITLIAMRFAHAILEKLIKDWHLTKLNSLSGGLLGFVKGLLLCLIITFFAVMVSETTRDMVFSAKTGPSLVQMITQIGVFVPKDSYEFVHSQLAQFRDKVDETIPGQPPETLQVQSSEAVKRVLAQLQEVDVPKEIGASSLMSAVSNWWNGTQVNAAETEGETLSLTQQAVQTTESNEPFLPPASSYTPPLPPTRPTNMVNTDAQAKIPSGVSQPNVLKPTLSQLTDEQFFIRRSEHVAGTQAQQSSALLSSIPVTPEPSLSAPLTALSPLAELSTPSASQLLPKPTFPRHVGSELLLHNSLQSTNTRGSASLFQQH